MNSARKESLGTSLSRGALTLRRRFYRLSVREKGLALLFAAALVALWFSNSLHRHRSAWETIALARSEAGMQREWLQREELIRREHETMVSQVNLATLPSREEVSSRIDGVVRRNGFSSFNLEQTRSEKVDEFTFHSVPLSIQKITYIQLKGFLAEVRTVLPGVNLERISIRPQPKDDQFLDASFVFKSIEYTQ